jgi:putative flippase GtrA
MNSLAVSSQQFLKFIVVGGFSTLINYGVFFALWRFVALDYRICSAAGFLVGLTVGYPLNKIWTYQHAGKTSFWLGARYLLVYLFSLGMGLAALWALVDQCNMLAWLANLLVIGLTTCINFIGTKFLVFKTC